MRFIHRYHKPISLITLTMLLVATTATPVSADYNAKLGRFQQRDPNGQGLICANGLLYHGANPTVTVSMAYELQFADGMNFYEYVRSDPIVALDPTGEFTLRSQVVSMSLRLGLMASVFGAIGGSVGDALFNPESTWETRGRAGLYGGVGGFVGGATSGVALAWSGVGGLMALTIGGTIEGGVDAGVQSALYGGSCREVIADSFSGAVLSGVSAGILGGFVRGLRGGADDAARGLTRAEKAGMGEAAAARTMARAGYIELPARLPGDRGFDGVFVRFGPDGSPVDIIITESKYSSTGHASLRQTGMGQQLSPGWVQANIQNMLGSTDPGIRQTGELLRQNRALVRIKANVLTPDGVNRWNVLP